MAVAVSSDDIDIMLMTRPHAGEPGQVFWFAGGLIDTFPTFEDFFWQWSTTAGLTTRDFFTTKPRRQTPTRDHREVRQSYGLDGSAQTAALIFRPVQLPQAHAVAVAVT
jgi:hypothetical protein